MKANRIFAVILTLAFVFIVGCGGGGSSSAPDPGPASGPSISISNLPDNVLVGKLVPVFVSTDAVRVELLVDSTLVVADGIAPFELDFDSSGYATGQHSVSVKAYDAAGNTNVATARIWIDATEIRRRAMYILNNYCYGRRDLYPSGQGWSLTVGRFTNPLMINLDGWLESWGTGNNPDGTTRLDGLPKIEKAVKVWNRYTGLGIVIGKIYNPDDGYGHIGMSKAYTAQEFDRITTNASARVRQ